MIAPPLSMTFRLAGRADCEAIAQLHAASWRAHYRDSLTDAFLDGPIEAERRQVWAERFDHPADAPTVVVAEEGGLLLGFVCAFVRKDAVYGTLIDNLHITIERKGGGIGRALMRDMAARLTEAAPDHPVHLFVKEMNVAARGFYERIGGRPAGREVHQGSDGSQSPVIRILWASPAALLSATADT